MCFLLLIKRMGPARPEKKQRNTSSLCHKDEDTDLDIAEQQLINSPQTSSDAISRNAYLWLQLNCFTQCPARKRFPVAANLSVATRGGHSLFCFVASSNYNVRETFDRVKRCGQALLTTHNNIGRLPKTACVEASG